MFCQKCGMELHKGDMFCWNCGTEIPSVAEDSCNKDSNDPEMTFEQAETQDSETANTRASDRTQNETEGNRFQSEASGNARQQQATENSAKHGDSLFNRFWNHPLFTKAAIQFNRFWDWIYAIITLPLSIRFFQYDDTFYGIFFFGFFLCAVYNIVRRHQKRRKARASVNTICPQCGRYVGGARFCPECGTAMPQPEVEDLDEDRFDLDNTSTLRNKKIGLLLTPIAIVIWIFLWNVMFGSSDIVYTLKNAPAMKHSSQTIEEVIDKNFTSPKWTSEKITDDCVLVYIEGYMQSLEQDIKITYLCQPEGGNIAYSLAEVEYIDTGEIFNDDFSLGFFMLGMLGNAA